jgi:anti-sigma regulatory factor (Ser/Thr protein kinase)
MQTSISIPAASEGIAMARDLVSRAMSGSETSLKRIDDAKLLTSEVVTNALRHSGLGAEDSIGLAVEMLADRVRIEVSDDGHGFDISVVDAPSAKNESGWGLFLVQEVSDGWGVIKNDPNIVWFELNL